MRRLQGFFTTLFASLFTVQVFAMSPASIQLCFTPSHGNDKRSSCTARIVEAIHGAKKSLLIQAYSFTSPAIEDAVILANRRGVHVAVLLDKSQCHCNAGYYYGGLHDGRQVKFGHRPCSAKLLSANGVPVLMDYKVAIAHNKVMVVDGREVITGSFNFTLSAQNKNAENLLIINSLEVASQYADNWHKRASASIPLAKFESLRTRKGKLKYGLCT